jgi:hypothetical protein
VHGILKTASLWDVTLYGSHKTNVSVDLIASIIREKESASYKI